MNDGSIVIGAEMAAQAHLEATTQRDLLAAGLADALAASCVDAKAEAAASGQPVPPETVALCDSAPAPAAVTQAVVLQAFRQLPLYHGAIRSDPQGWTLVNLDTRFWCADETGRACTTIGEGELVITLLGRPVRIRPHITGYEWDFGDGSGAVSAGTAETVTHIFRSKTTASVTVTLTWTGQYSVSGRPFAPISGTTTTTSQPLALPVREARSVLIGGG